MSKYNLVNIVLCIITVIAVIVLIVLYSSVMTGTANVATGAAIYEDAVSTVSKANLDNAQAQAQNAQFEAFLGANKSAMEVKQLISFVNSNNSRPSSSSKPTKVAVKLNNTLISDSSSIVSGKTYSVNTLNKNTSDEDPTQSSSSDASYYTSGFIRIINIQEN